MEMNEMDHQDEDEVVFTLNMDGNEILDLKPSSPREQEQGKANTVEEVWDTDSTEFLLLSCYQYINSFRTSEDEAQRQWINISTRLSRTPKSCQRQFKRLQNKYFQLARSQFQEDSNTLNAVDINWPYFDLFFKMCQYTQLVKSKPVHDVDKLNIELLQYYTKHKRLFMAAEFGGEMRLWSIFAKDALEPEECAYQIRYLRWSYLNLKAKVAELNSPNIEKMYSRRQEYRMWSMAFDPPAPEPVSEVVETKIRKSAKPQSQPRKARWSHDKIMSLVQFYSDNRDLFKYSITRDLWKPLTKRVNKTASECHKKFGELAKKYEHFKEKLLHLPNAKVRWRYYAILDNLLSENTTSCDVIKEGNIAEKDHSTDSVVIIEENVPDDDTVCIIVSPEENDGNLNTILSTAPLKPQDKMPQSQVIEDASLRWAKKAKTKLLNLYKDYIKSHKSEVIKEIEMWKAIGAQMKRSPVQCRRHFNMLKTKYFKMVKLHNQGEKVDWPYFSTCRNVFRYKPSIKKDPKGMAELERVLAPRKAEVVQVDKVSAMLNYYLANVEEFVSPKFKKNNVWAGMGRAVGMGWQECKRMFTELQENHISSIKSGEANSSAHFVIFEQIWEKEREILAQLENDPIITYSEEAIEKVGFDVWDDTETLKLLKWYHLNLYRFKNRKYIHKYIWRETETALGLNPTRCSKKMRDIRAAYRAKLLQMQKLKTKECRWEYFDICKKIYGTDLKDPFLGKTKRPKLYYLQQGSERVLKKRRRKEKVMSKETVERLVNYYLENYDLFQRPPTGVARQVWEDLASEIGFSNLACQKKFEFLKRQYNHLLSNGDHEALGKWAYTGLMKRAMEYINYKEWLAD